MIDERFSAEAFVAQGLDTEAARHLADQLALEIQLQFDAAMLNAMEEIVGVLNGLGHSLFPIYAPRPGHISYRDDSGAGVPYWCRLRVAVDTVVSTGYAHLEAPDEPDDRT